MQPTSRDHDALKQGGQIAGRTVDALLRHDRFGFTYRCGDCEVREYFPDFASRRDGTVHYSAEDSDLYSTNMQLFLKLGHFLEACNEPSVVKVRETHRDSDRACLVMDRVGGDTMEALLEKTDPSFDQARVLKILTQLLVGLKLLHDGNLVHGNLCLATIKTLNAQPVMIDPLGHVPPGSRLEGPQADIYGMATVAHQLLYGHAPAKLEDRLRVSSHLHAAIVAGLEVHDAHRLRNLDEFRELLSEPSPDYARPDSLWTTVLVTLIGIVAGSLAILGINSCW